MAYTRNWLYLTLLAVDIVHLTLSVWGTVIFANAIHGCYLEVPVTSNFVFILIVLGYVYFLRIFPLIFVYKFGVRIQRYFRRTLRLFRKYDQTLQEKFPVYEFKNYQNLHLTSEE